ncbi:pickpocket protein 28-like isoform X2 [Tribolium madens]|uniref:pickpocket protein 28-like isoform X2 n=1 Tax=Tribolium madens TaxID=41895 RepID=UPI001CF71EEB|nr:pickpocket protein 28-like isoform X2 [Tribolium madens]
MNSSPNRTTISKTLTNTTNYFKQYCSATSIHGFQYFGEDRSIFEKIWWSLIFIICLSGCSIMIYKIYEKYETSPVIVSFATKETPLYKIPFPAVTICPEVKSDVRKFNLTNVFMKKKNNLLLSETEFKNLQYMSLLCDDIDEFRDILINDTLDEFSDNILESLDQIKPAFLPIECKFLGEENQICEDLFIPIFTDEGVCYTFNMLDRSHIFTDRVNHYKGYHKIPNDTKSWNMEQGYLDNSKLWVYPWRALFSGANHGLILYLATEEENVEYKCKGIQGFKVVLHSPVRMPRLKQEYIRIPLNQAVVALVHPVVIETSEAVKTFDPEKRFCYFPTERKLQYFRSYSQQNCLFECLTKITLKMCDCVSIFMPSNNMISFSLIIGTFIGDNGTKICGLSKQKCVKQAEEAMHLGELNVFHDVKIDFDGCDCMPLCTDLSYNVETSQTHWNWKNALKEDLDPNILKKSFHLSSLTIYFKFNHFITSQRHELYGPTDFVANFGGLLGLFMGFSILSLAEILYFFTVRICCNVRLYGNWIGLEE